MINNSLPPEERSSDGGFLCFDTEKAAAVFLRDARHFLRGNALESGEEMTVENVRKQSRFHPRCGTSFIFVMIILSILVSSVVALAFPSLTQIRPVWICVKLLIMPIVMGLGYEFIRYAGKHDNLFVKILSAPGLWMQRITTAEPDDSMIEVGIAAINAVIPHNDEEKVNIDKVEETENISEEPGKEEG